MNGLALCAGVGMLDEGVGLALRFLGCGYRTVCYVEREAAAAAQLVTLMEAGCIDHAPIWSDLLTFDGAAWRGRVDCVTAGFPCQPHSVAGQRKGLDDERWIWPGIVRIIGDVRPDLVFLENVPGLASTGGLDACIADLAALGFAAEWGVLSAAAVGASHERERLFILAYSAGARFGERKDAGTDRSNAGENGCGRIEPERIGGAVAHPGCSGQRRTAQSAGLDRERPSGDDCGASRDLADSERDGCQRRGEPGDVARSRCDAEGKAHQWQRRGPTADSCNRAMADTDGIRRRGEGDGEQQTARADIGELPIFAPGPSSPLWQWIIAASPWLAPAIESDVRCVVDGMPLLVDESRTDQLRAIGNGVVALSAACAYVQLARRVGLTCAPSS